MAVYRLHIRPKDGLTLNPKSAFQYCLDEKVLGIGWALRDKTITSATWEEYEAKIAADNIYKSISRVKYFKKYLKENDLIWTRDSEGNYHLGLVKSGWKYLGTSRGYDVDIVNVVSCEISKRIDIEQVPGKIIAHFRAGQTIREINPADEDIVNYSYLLWNRLSGTNHYPNITINSSNIFSFLTDQDAEDLVCIYLQVKKEWIFIPSSRKADTMNYEFYLKNREGKTAKVQVKTGNTAINKEEYKSSGEKFFLFQTNGIYLGKTPDNVEVIEREEIEKFIKSSQTFIPSHIINRMNLINLV